MNPFQICCTHFPLDQTIPFNALTPFQAFLFPPFPEKSFPTTAIVSNALLPFHSFLLVSGEHICFRQGLNPLSRMDVHVASGRHALHMYPVRQAHQPGDDVKELRPSHQMQRVQGMDMPRLPQLGSRGEGRAVPQMRRRPLLPSFQYMIEVPRETLHVQIKRSRVRRTTIQNKLIKEILIKPESFKDMARLFWLPRESFQSLRTTPNEG